MKIFFDDESGGNPYTKPLNPFVENFIPGSLGLVFLQPSISQIFIHELSLSFCALGELTLGNSSA